MLYNRVLGECYIRVFNVNFGECYIRVFYGYTSDYIVLWYSKSKMQGF